MAVWAIPPLLFGFLVRILENRKRDLNMRSGLVDKVSQSRYPKLGHAVLGFPGIYHVRYRIEETTAVQFLPDVVILLLTNK